MKRVINTSRKKLDLALTYKQDEKYEFKPKGLWYSIDGEWLEWCEGNMPHWVKPRNIEIELDESKIIIIETAKQLRDFEERFGYDMISPIKGITACRLMQVRWSKVAECYSGIEIRNYHKIKWSGDLNWSTWFYGWDISGGCIWDLSIINSYCLIKTKKDGVLH